MHWKRNIRYCLLVGTSALLLIGTSCNDQIEIPDEPLTGKVAGKDWEIKFGSFRQFSASEFEYRFYSQKEVTTDACALFASTNPYISVVIPSGQASTSLPIIDPLRAFKFHFGNGSSVTANSGFVEVFAFDGFQIHGYIEAEFDENNTVQGRFTIDPC